MKYDLHNTQIDVCQCIPMNSSHNVISKSGYDQVALKMIINKTQLFTSAKVR